MSESGPIRTLHVDIEGGWGGSSRSLFELIRNMDRSRVEPVVAHRQEGPVTERYASIGVRTYHVPEIGSFAPRPVGSWKIFLGSLPRLMKTRRAAKKLTDIARQHDSQLVHLNYEGLFLLAKSLGRTAKLPLVGHSRTHIPLNAWGSWVVNTLSRQLEHIFFISTMEEENYRTLERGTPLAGDVLWNIAPEPLARGPLDDPPEAVYLGSLDFTKGTDRLIEIAAQLQEMDAPALRVTVYGEARKDPSISRALRDKVENSGLQDRINFAGYTKEPEKILSRAFAVIRPSRGNDPWGRDLIEAARAGVPALATGSFGGVIQHGETGYLFPEYDPREMAQRLVELRSNPGTWKSMSEAASAFAAKKFGGRDQAEIFAEVAERVVRDKERTSRE